MVPLKKIKQVQEHRSVRTLATTLVEQRKALFLTQQEVADLAHVSVNFIRQVEAGKTSVHLEKVLDIMTALGLEFCIRPGNSRINFNMNL